jgi:hypothetical protein
MINDFVAGPSTASAGEQMQSPVAAFNQSEKKKFKRFLSLESPNKFSPHDQRRLHEGRENGIRVCV